MYRRYENPGKVQELLKIAEAKLETAILKGEDEERIFDLHEDVEELKDRLRFAWDDDEYDETYAMENYPEDYQ